MIKPDNDKIWEQLIFYKKNASEIMITYNRVTVSGVITKMRYLMCRPYAILDSSGVLHKIFIEDIKEGTIFPTETKIEEHFVNPSHYRKSIPRSIRNEVWRDRFEDNFIGRCFVCKCEIRKDNWEAGHVISVNEGGQDTVDNLRPICRTCNRSMGIENLEDFKRNYYS